MGKLTGFMEYERLDEPHEEPQARPKPVPVARQTFD